MNKCQHEPESGFTLRVCTRCGATAMSQRTCKKCHRQYCKECQKGTPTATPAEQQAAKALNSDLGRFYRETR